jgi:hypothetical protein
MHSNGALMAAPRAQKEKKMKTTASCVLFAMLCAIVGASSATVHVVECTKEHGKCPPPPAPPAMAAMPALSTTPAPQPPLPLPQPPLPPPPPKAPDVPAAAHAACAGKAPGTELTYTVSKGEYMRGVCEREDGKMVFVMQVYHQD